VGDMSSVAEACCSFAGGWTQATQVGVTMGASSCFRVTPPFCDWQIISRTLVIVPDRRLSHVEVLQSSVSIPSTARFTLAASAKIVMAGFKVRPLG
jgi:hypothetical protein